MSRQTLVHDLGKDWTPWGGGMGLGFSLKRGERRADVGRAKNPATGLIEWYAKTWTGTRISEARTTFTGQDFHDAIALAESDS